MGMLPLSVALLRNISIPEERGGEGERGEGEAGCEGTRLCQRMYQRPGKARG